jgi:hypothetical protein
MFLVGTVINYHHIVLDVISIVKIIYFVILLSYIVSHGFVASIIVSFERHLQIFLLAIMGI